MLVPTIALNIPIKPIVRIDLDKEVNCIVIELAKKFVGLGWGSDRYYIRLPKARAIDLEGEALDRS